MSVEESDVAELISEFDETFQLLAFWNVTLVKLLQP